MKNFNRVLLYVLAIMLLLLIICSTGCNNHADAAQVIQKGSFQLELLFEEDGCKMYRFYDGNRYVYWANCKGRVQSDYSTQSGKIRSEHKEESVTTE